MYHGFILYFQTGKQIVDLFTIALNISFFKCGKIVLNNFLGLHYKNKYVSKSGKSGT